MKYIIAILFLSGVNAFSANLSQKVNAKKQNSMGASLSIEHQFDDLAVRGRYQSAFEARATVEAEKNLKDLLDYRTNYDDRLKKMNEQN